MCRERAREWGVARIDPCEMRDARTGELDGELVPHAEGPLHEGFRPRQPPQAQPCKIFGCYTWKSEWAKEEGGLSSKPNPTA